MEILHAATAGTLESSDVQITVLPSGELDVTIESDVIHQYGNHIRQLIMESLQRMGVQHGEIRVIDKGALDCTLEARLETVLHRALRRIEYMEPNNTKKNRIRRTMMFLNAQRPSLLQDAYIYRSDSLIFDLEDAVAEREKDSARFSLYHALTSIDYQGCEKVVRINGLDTPHYREDIRVCVAAGADTIRIPKCETRDDVLHVAELVSAAEKEYGRTEGSTCCWQPVNPPGEGSMRLRFAMLRSG